MYFPALGFPFPPVCKCRCWPVLSAAKGKLEHRLLKDLVAVRLFGVFKRRFVRKAAKLDISKFVHF